MHIIVPSNQKKIGYSSSQGSSNLPTMLYNWFFSVELNIGVFFQELYSTYLVVSDLLRYMFSFVEVLR